MWIRFNIQLFVSNFKRDIGVILVLRQNYLRIQAQPALTVYDGPTSPVQPGYIITCVSVQFSRVNRYPRSDSENIMSLLLSGYSLTELMRIT